MRLWQQELEPKGLRKVEHDRYLKNMNLGTCSQDGMPKETKSAWFDKLFADCEPPTPQVPFLLVKMAFAAAANYSSAFAAAANYTSASADATGETSAQEEYCMHSLELLPVLPLS